MQNLNFNDIEDSDIEKYNRQSGRMGVVVTVCLIVIAMLLIGVFFLIFTPFKMAGVSSVKILEFDNLQELQCLSVSDVSSAENTLYKVGDDYYSYFPSTGKLELVTQVHDYDTASIDLLDSLYSGLPTSSESDDYVTVTNKVETIEVFVSVLDERTGYLQKELDNVNSNILLADDTTELEKYKAQLEEELRKLIEYRVSVSALMPLILDTMKSDEINGVLVEKVNKILDDNMLSIHDSSKYVTSAEFTALKDTVNEQQKMLDILTKTVSEYTDIEDIIIAKTDALITATENSNDKDLLEMTETVLDTVEEYVDTYASEVETLTDKITILETLYKTIEDGKSDTKYTSEVVVNLNKYYNELETATAVRTYKIP